MKVSWVILTHNRNEIVERAFVHNWRAIRSSDDIEIIIVDNGSRYRQGINDCADVTILNSDNLGVAKGYNRGMAMATGDWIVITGCDMLMPDNWLKTFADYATNVPNTACVSMYTVEHHKATERMLNGGNVEGTAEFPYIQAMPIDRRMFRRSLLKEIGYLREDMGLYGWEDVEWAARLMRHSREKGLLTYVVPGQLARHLQKEESYITDPKMQEYERFKKEQSSNPKTQEVLEWCRVNNYPFYSPY